MQARKLGPFLATMFVTGNMIGSGLFLLPASMGAIGGISLLSWLCAALGALLLAGMFARLGVIAPWAGGPLAYAQATLGPYFGFQANYIYWLCNWIGNVGIAVAVSGYLSTFLPMLDTPLASTCATVAVIWVATLVNILGARVVGAAETAALAIGLVPVLLVGVLGWWWFDPQLFLASWNVSGKSALQVVPSTVIVVFWAFLGLETAAVAAEVVEHPRRNLPIAVLGGVGLAALVYAAACSVPLGIVPASELAASPAPFTLVSERLFGHGLAQLVSLAAILKAGGTLFGWSLVAVASAKAAAEADLFPRVFAITDRRGVAVPSFLFHGGLMTLVAFASMAPTIGQQFARLADVSVLFTLVLYLYSAFALWRLTPAGMPAVWRDRALALAAAAFSIWVAWTSDRDLLLVAAAIMATSVPAWLLFRALRRRPPKSAAGSVVP